MTFGSSTIMILILSCLYFGCASNTATEEDLTPAGPTIPEYLDIKVKEQYLHNVKESLKLYEQVILDLKYYHDINSFKDFAKEIDRYVDIYVKNIRDYYVLYAEDFSDDPSWTSTDTTNVKWSSSGLKPSEHPRIKSKM